MRHGVDGSMPMLFDATPDYADIIIILCWLIIISSFIDATHYYVDAAMPMLMMLAMILRWFTIAQDADAWYLMPLIFDAIRRHATRSCFFDDVAALCAMIVAAVDARRF